MCQAKVIELLKSKKHKWFSAREVYTALKIVGMPSINMSLKKLYEFKVVERRDARIGQHHIYIYRYAL